MRDHCNAKRVPAKKPHLSGYGVFCKRCRKAGFAIVGCEVGGDGQKAEANCARHKGELDDDQGKDCANPCTREEQLISPLWVRARAGCDAKGIKK